MSLIILRFELHHTTALINKAKEVRVHGIDYLISHMNAEDKLLIVDDVFDSGRSIKAILDTLNEKSRKNIHT